MTHDEQDGRTHNTRVRRSCLERGGWGGEQGGGEGRGPTLPYRPAGEQESEVEKLKARLRTCE